MELARVEKIHKLGIFVPSVLGAIEDIRRMKQMRGENQITPILVSAPFVSIAPLTVIALPAMIRGSRISFRKIQTLLFFFHLGHPIRNNE